MKPSTKNNRILNPRKRGRKKQKHVQKDIAVKLLPKNLNGSSNWEQLSKVIGYDLSKRKPLSSTDFIMDSIPSQSKGTPRNNGLAYKNNVVPKQRGGCSKASRSTDGSSANEASTNVFRTAVSDPVYDVNNSFPSSRSSQQNSKVFRQTKPPVGANPVIQNSSGLQTQRHGLTRVIAMDCEMVGTGPKGEDSMIARVSLVNQWCACLYDAYVKPVMPVTDYRTPVSGIRPHDLRNAKDLLTVQREVQQILDGRILVGHALKNDLSVLFISHPKTMIRDTSKYKPFRQLFNGQTPSLKKLAEKILGTQIQTGEHSSVEDAQAAMQIYLTHKREWEDTVKFIRKKRIHHQQQQQQQQHGQ